MASQSLFLFPYQWQSGDAITGRAGSSTDFPPGNLENFFRHSVGRDDGANKGLAQEGWHVSFNNTSRDIAGIVVMDYNVKQDSASNPAIKFLCASDDPFSTTVYRTVAAKCRQIDEYSGLLLAPHTGANEWSWIVHVDTDTDLDTASTGSPKYVPCKSILLRFWTEDAADAYWQSSMVVPLVDPVLITNIDSNLGAASYNVEYTNIDVLDGIGMEFTIRWNELNHANAAAIFAVYGKASDSPVYCLPDTRVARDDGNGAFTNFARASFVGRGGLVTFKNEPKYRIVHERPSDQIYSVTATFQTWGKI